MSESWTHNYLDARQHRSLASWCKRRRITAIIDFRTTYKTVSGKITKYVFNITEEDLASTIVEPNSLRYEYCSLLNKRQKFRCCLELETNHETRCEAKMYVKLLLSLKSMDSIPEDIIRYEICEYLLGENCLNWRCSYQIPMGSSLGFLGI